MFRVLYEHKVFFFGLNFQQQKDKKKKVRIIKYAEIVSFYFSNRSDDKLAQYQSPNSKVQLREFKKKSLWQLSLKDSFFKKYAMIYSDTLQRASFLMKIFTPVVKLREQSCKSIYYRFSPESQKKLQLFDTNFTLRIAITQISGKYTGHS